jgi:cytochrome b561
MTHRLSNTTLFLHWSVALLMIALLALGLIMHDNKLYDLYPIHKSLGMLILPLALFRAYWRLKEKWPQPAHQLYGIWIHLSKIAHLSLLSLTVLMPISGILMSLLSGRGLTLFTYPIILAQKNDQGELIALSEYWAKIAHQLHFLFSDLLIILLGAHIIAGLIHHFLLKDDVLNRMMFFYKK